MKKRVLTILLLFLALLVFASWQYRLLCLLLIVVVNREWVKSRLQQRWYKVLVGGLVLAVFLAMPNFFQRGRTQLTISPSRASSASLRCRLTSPTR